MLHFLLSRNLFTAMRVVNKATGAEEACYYTNVNLKQCLKRKGLGVGFFFQFLWWTASRVQSTVFCCILSMEIFVPVEVTKQKTQPSVMCLLIQNTQKIAAKGKENLPGHAPVLTEHLCGLDGVTPGTAGIQSCTPSTGCVWHRVDRRMLVGCTACSDAAGGFGSHTELHGRGVVQSCVYVQLCFLYLVDS